jgi:hypothetical protein
MAKVSKLMVKTESLPAVAHLLSSPARTKKSGGRKKKRETMQFGLLTAATDDNYSGSHDCDVRKVLRAERKTARGEKEKRGIQMDGEKRKRIGNGERKKKKRIRTRSRFDFGV